MVDRLSYHAQIVWVVVLAIESITIIASNIVAISIFSKRKFVVCKSAYLLINLTIADALVGVAPLLHLVELIYSTGSSQSECGVVINVVSKVYSFFTIMASLSCLALIALERVFATFKPHHHRRIQRRHYMYTITASWCATLVATTFKGITNCISGKIVLVFTSFMTFFVAMCILMIVVPYLAIALKMRFFSSFQSGITQKNNARLSKTLMITTMLAILTTHPTNSCPTCWPKM